MQARIGDDEHMDVVAQQWAAQHPVAAQTGSMCDASINARKRQSALTRSPACHHEAEPLSSLHLWKGRIFGCYCTSCKSLNAPLVAVTPP